MIGISVPRMIDVASELHTINDRFGFAASILRNSVSAVKATSDNMRLRIEVLKKGRL